MRYVYFVSSDRRGLHYHLPVANCQCWSAKQRQQTQIGQSQAMWQCKWHNLVVKFVTYVTGVTWWPTLEPMALAMQVTSPEDQILNQCKWCCQMTVKFATKAGSQISNQCKLIHMVAKFVASYAIGAMVKFVTNSIGAIWWSNLQLMRQLQLNQGPNNPIVCCASGNVG